MVLLDCDEDRAKYLYESRLLQVAVDLSDRGARRMTVRIWRRSVIAYMSGDRSWLSGGIDANARADVRAVAAMLQESVPLGDVLLSRLQDLWSVSSTHLHDLLEAGELTAVPGQTLKPKQSPLLIRKSVLEFLTRRRIA